jgi:hypothetical protein
VKYLSQNVVMGEVTTTPYCSATPPTINVSSSNSIHLEFVLVRQEGEREIAAAHDTSIVLAAP